MPVSRSIRPVPYLLYTVPVSGSVVGRWVLLVDDVVTTGATLAACGEAIKGAGALAVSAIAVARER